MTVSVMYGIPQIMPFKWYSILHVVLAPIVTEIIYQLPSIHIVQIEMSNKTDISDWQHMKYIRHMSMLSKIILQQNAKS